MGNKFECVIFDLDGTLLDTVDDLKDCMDSVLIDNNLPVHTRQEYISYVGNGIRLFVQRSLPPQMNDEAFTDRILEMFLPRYDRICTNKTFIYPGIKELLDFLESGGYRISILSNKSDALVKSIVTQLLSSWNFDFVSGSREDYPRKPDPKLALEICNALDLSPDNCIFIGDSDIDINTAINAGMFPIGVTWGYGNPELIESVMTVNTPQEIMCFLEDMNSHF